MGEHCNCLLYNLGGRICEVHTYLLFQGLKGPWTCTVVLKGAISYWVYYVYYVFQGGTLRKGWGERLTCLLLKGNFTILPVHGLRLQKGPTLLTWKSLDLYEHWGSSVQDISHRIFVEILTDISPSTEKNICIQHSFHPQVIHHHHTKSEPSVGNGDWRKN